MVAPNPDGASLVLAQVFVVLVAARATGALADRLGFTSVVGELTTGFVLGPSVLGAAFPALQRRLFRSTEALDAVALLGLVFLLYTAGAETDFGLIRGRARAVVAAGLLGMVLPFALGAGLGLALPPDLGLVPPTTTRSVFGLFLGVALSISAIPVAVRVLRDLDALSLPVGQVTVATAMFTDVVGWLGLSVVAGVARSGAVDAALVGRTVAALVAFLAVAFAVGPRLVDAAFARFGGGGDPAGAVALGAVAALGSSALCVALGVEPAVGAFVAGLVVSQADAGVGVDVRGTGEATGDGALESVTFGVFAPVFFGAAGLRADLGLLFDPTVALVGTATLLVAVVGKFVGAYAGATVAGYSRAEAAVLGSGLNARGAVEIAVATVGLELGVLGRGMYTVIVGVAVLTSAMTPPLLRVTLRRLPGRADADRKEVSR